MEAIKNLKGAQQSARTEHSSAGNSTLVLKYGRSLFTDWLKEQLTKEDASGVKR